MMVTLVMRHGLQNMSRAGIRRGSDVVVSV